MPFDLNGAGGSTADPILRGLGLRFITGVETMDADNVQDAWIDQAAGFPGTNSVKASLSPAATVVTRGQSATYDDTNKRVALTTTTGLSAGDYLYLSHGSITAGLYQIASIPAAGSVTLVDNPFDGGGARTGIAFEVAWSFIVAAGTAPTVSSASGQTNYWKFRADDDLNQVSEREDSVYIREAPTGAGFVAIDSKSYTGQATADNTPSISILAGWLNMGGVYHVGFGNHSTQSRRDISWWDGSSGYKTRAEILANPNLVLNAGDGMKYAQLIFRSRASASIQRTLDIDIRLDQTGPSLISILKGE